MSRNVDSEVQFVNPDIDDIIAELTTQYELTVGRTVQPSSPEKLFISWVADALMQAYVGINYAANQNIPSRAEGENLDALGELFFDKDRPEASEASVTMRFHISEAQSTTILIPAGTRVSPASGDPIFETEADASVTIGSTYVDVHCTCQTVGADGNGYTAGQINNLIDPFPYYDHCENITESAGGTDEATDDEYYDLMVASEDAYSCAGATGAYEYWAKSVSTDIADVIVTSPSAGQVNIHALMADHTIAGAEIKQLIYNACNADEHRPLTDYVQVVDPDVVRYNVKMTYYTSRESPASIAEIQAAVEEAVAEFNSWQSSRLGRDINPSKLTEYVMKAGAKRVVITQPAFTSLHDGSESPPQTPQIALVNTITLTNGGQEDE